MREASDFYYIEERGGNRRTRQRKISSKHVVQRQALQVPEREHRGVFSRDGYSFPRTPGALLTIRPTQKTIFDRNTLTCSYGFNELNHVGRRHLGVVLSSVAYVWVGESCTKYKHLWVDERHMICRRTALLRVITQG